MELFAQATAQIVCMLIFMIPIVTVELDATVVMEAIIIHKTETAASTGKENNMGFFDGKGIYRNKFDGGFDARGIWRSCGEGGYDYMGIYRSSGDGGYDARGIFRSPGEGGYDSKGIYRDGFEGWSVICH